MTILEEEARRRAALALQAQIVRSVTRAKPVGAGGVTGPGRPAEPQRENGPERGEDPRSGKKIASSSVRRRTPQTGERTPESPPVIPESRKTKPNKRENEFMLNLMVLRNTLHTNAQACRERAGLAGRYVWRDMRLMLRLVDKIQEALLRTMPASRDEYYAAYARHGHYELRIDGPVRTPRQLLVTDRHLAAMAEAAMKSECILCMREGAEISRCELREALLETAAPTAVEEGGSLWRKCEYRDAAGALVQGKDVTV